MRTTASIHRTGCRARRGVILATALRRGRASLTAYCAAGLKRRRAIAEQYRLGVRRRVRSTWQDRFDAQRSRVANQGDLFICRRCRAGGRPQFDVVREAVPLLPAAVLAVRAGNRSRSAAG